MNTGPRELPDHMRPLRGSAVDSYADFAARVECDIEMTWPIGLARLIPFTDRAPDARHEGEWRTRLYRRQLARFAWELLERSGTSSDELLGDGARFIMPQCILFRIRLASVEETAAKGVALLRSPGGTHLSRRVANAIADALEALIDRSVQSVRRSTAA